jgi:hypothetical protein
MPTTHVHGISPAILVSLSTKHTYVLFPLFQYLKWHKRPFLGPSLITLLLSPVGSLCISERVNGS